MLFKPTHSLGLLVCCCLPAVVGCQLNQTVSAPRLIQHQAMVDPTGLKDAQTIDSVKVHISSPQKWDALKPKSSALYTHQQWRSPSRQTGVGVAYGRLPIPLPAKAIVWLAQSEYTKRDATARLLSSWEDSLGRPWFEAENSKYHIRGYIVTRGFDAWVIYCGYKREQPPSSYELSIAFRALETIVPTPFAKDIPQRPLATNEAGEVKPQF